MPDTATATATAPASFSEETHKATRKGERTPKAEPTPTEKLYSELVGVIRSIVGSKGSDQVAFRRSFARQLIAGHYAPLAAKGKEYRVGIVTEAGVSCSLPPSEWALLGMTAKLTNVGKIAAVRDNG